MLIYRVEHTTVVSDHNGLPVGPYRLDHTSPLNLVRMGEDLCAAASPDTHPLPHEDGIPYVFTSMSCGFASRASLCAWFPVRERRMLEDNGYAVSVYRAHRDDVVFGGRQVMFDVCESILLRKVSPLAV